MVTEFRSAAAEKGWTDFKALWATVNPNANNYNFMQEPLMAGEVWIAWDHIARVKDALTAEPDKYLVVPPPAGSQGRAYMPVVAGLAIAKDAPNRAQAAAVIEHLLKPATQIATAMEVGFFPVINAPLPAPICPPASSCWLTASPRRKAPRTRSSPCCRSASATRAASSTRSISTPSSASCCGANRSAQCSIPRPKPCAR
jgi:ABC-type Fe3+ transport system substrate-binding protein